MNANIAVFREMRDASITHFLPAGAQGVGGMTDIDMSLGFDMWLLFIVIPPFWRPLPTAIANFLASLRRLVRADID